MAYPTLTSLTGFKRPRGTNGRSITFSGSVPNAQKGSETATITGVQPGQMIYAVPRSQLTEGLIMNQPPVVTAVNTVTFYWYNASGAPITPGTIIFDYIVF